ncbi:MAG: S1C family serine protease [Bacillota bacterium]|jgi:S1-C subfamily serine protease
MLKSGPTRKTETILLLLAVAGIVLGGLLTVKDTRIGGVTFRPWSSVIPPVTHLQEDDWRIQDELNTINVFEVAKHGVVMVSTERLGPGGSGIATRGNGSGFFINDEGYLVTNHHVVDGCDTITVHTYRGYPYPATIVGTDRLTDLALLKVTIPKYEITALPFADYSLVRVGQKAIVVGSPLATGSSLGLDRSPTVTTGIISAIDRSLPVQSLTRPGVNDYTIENLIQTDAAVNPGNSGGPLLNSSGEIVGVVTAIIDSATGIGFAIPSNVVQEVIPEIMRNGEVKRAFMGVAYQPLDEIAKAIGEAFEELGLPTREGALITDVDPGGPADKAGLVGGSRKVTVRGQDVMLGGDIIIAIDETKIQGSNLTREILKYKPGDEVQIEVLREGRKLQMTLVLGSR